VPDDTLAALRQALDAQLIVDQGERYELTRVGWLLYVNLMYYLMFVAMWLTEEMEPVYEDGLEPGIRNAGFNAMLIRNKEHANKIDDEIIAEIRNHPVKWGLTDFSQFRGRRTGGSRIDRLRPRRARHRGRNHHHQCELPGVAWANRTRAPRPRPGSCAPTAAGAATS
jgi:hypothetical protein